MITLDVNGKEYRILRVSFFKDQKKQAYNFQSKVILYRNDEDISEKDVNKTNAKIIEIVGTSDELIQSCIMEQGKNESFIDLKDADKKKYVCNITKLDIYNNIHDRIIQENKLHMSKMRDYNNRLYENPKNKNVCNIDKLRDEINEYAEKLEKLQEEENEINEMYKIINKEKIEKELKISELSINDYSELENLNDIEEQLDNYKIQKEGIQIKKEKLESQIQENNNQISKFVNIEKKNETFERNKEKKIKKITDQINNLWKGYVKISKKQIGDIDKIQDENTEIIKNIKKNNKRIQNNESKISELKEKIEIYRKDKTNKQGYKKYLEMIKEIEQNENKNIVLMEKLEEIQLKIKEENKEYTKIKKQMNKKTDEKEILNEQLLKYDNIEKNKDKFEIQRKKKISKLMKLNQELSKGYEKVEEINDIDNNILSKLNEGLNNKIKIRNQIINEIEILNSTKENITEEMREQYNQFIDTNKLYNETKEILEVMKKENDENNKIIEGYKNHRYNIDCHICMTNEITTYKLEAEEKKVVFEERIKKQLKTIKLNETKLNKLKKYENIGLIDEKNKSNDIEIENKENIKEKIMLEIEKDELKILKIEKQKDDFNKNEKRISNNEKIGEEIESNNKEITKLQEEKYEEYETYKKVSEKYNLLKEELIEFNERIKVYEVSLKKEEEIKDDIVKNNKDRENIETDNEKYIIFGKQFEENEENKKQIDSLINETDKLKETLVNLELREEIVLKKIAEIEKLEEIEVKNQNIESSIKEKESELLTIKECKYEEYEIYKNLQTENDKMNQEIKDIELKLKEIIINEINLQTKYENNNELIEQKKIFDKLNVEIEKIIEKYNETKENMKLMKEKIITVNNKIINRKTEIKILEEYQEEIIKMEEEQNINNKIIEIIKNGFEDNILTNKIIPGIREKVNEILMEFVKFRVDMIYKEKTIKVEKIDEDGKTSSAIKMSGYEKLMTNIAFRIAINEWNKRYKTNFFIIDEGFAYCDEEATEKIERLFEYMKKKYERVIVVSHNEQIKSYTDVTIEIKRNNGFSKINMISKENHNEWIQEKYGNLMTEEKEEVKVEKKRKIILKKK